MQQILDSNSVHGEQAGRKFRVVIAGASGFVGRALVPELAKFCDIVALSRYPRRMELSKSDKSIEWRQCDLFSARQTEAALSGCDFAVFLVHSMLPSARLTQGSFDDLDLVIADNFGRAAKACGVKRVVYLGGIIPTGDLSRHLASRLEVEAAIASHGVPVIALRAGLVIGPGGSSFDMMRKLVQRLPAMLCPKWTRTRSSPVSIDDVVRVMTRVVLDLDLPAGSYDVGGSEVVTYLDMMRITASMMGKRRLMVPVFLFSPKLSRLWVRLVTGSPKELIAPLVESLRHEMIPRDSSIFERYSIRPVSFRDALRSALSAPLAQTKAIRLPRNVMSANLVCSVQRLPLPPGRDACWIASRYAHWLIQFLWPFIKVNRSEDGSLEFKFRFLLAGWEVTLLQLQYVAARSDHHRQLFFITGGVLTASNTGVIGRFEFREVLSGRYALAAIFDYPPALPWWVYKCSQAIVHLFVMHSFRAYLARICKKAKPRSI
jgi:uncharacterized protein YbjT (DUF2867 family)